MQQKRTRQKDWLILREKRPKMDGWTEFSEDDSEINNQELAKINRSIKQTAQRRQQFKIHFKASIIIIYVKFLEIMKNLWKPDPEHNKKAGRNNKIVK